MRATEIDFDARYSVDGYDGIAFYLRGWVVDQPAGEYWDDELEEYCWMDEPVHSDTQVVAVMVGDDYRWTFDVEDLTPLDELDYCHECGQIGCTHDGLER